MAYNERRNERPSYGRNEGRGDRRGPGEQGDMSRKQALPQQTQCRFCRRGEKYVDYKDIETLAKLLTHRGKIYSRKRSGNCAGCQRKVKRAIKRARYMALLPFTA
jgi:small subunit ribosomal protein S18